MATKTDKIEKVPTRESKDSLISALKNDFATTVYKVYISSLGREVGFREVTVTEQKTLARTTIDNNARNRKDVVFEAQCAMLNTACLEPNFNVFDCLEIDRLKLMIALYQANMFKNDVEFTCEECGTQNKYKLDFSNVMQKLNEIVVTDREVEYSSRNYNYKFKLAYPSVKRVLDFYRNYSKNYKGANKAQAKTLDEMSNMDYINLYIESVDINNSQTGLSKSVNFTDYSVADAEEILAVLPQDVLYAEDGVLKYITDNFVKVINDTFEVQHCYKCGAEYHYTVRSAESFL